MWQAFELIHKSFKDGAELYLEGMLSIRILVPYVFFVTTVKN